mmetsp:Transcript_88277/g.189522  ORF Transcript_88277/g.189522 Transcript_88277/m.189522 type:complete len:122 (-) Transcript_88277:139-504(-)
MGGGSATRSSSRRAASAHSARKANDGDKTAAMVAANAKVSWGAPGMRSETPPKLNKAARKAAQFVAEQQEAAGKAAVEERAWELLLCMAGAHAAGASGERKARAELRQLAEEARGLLGAEA